MTETNINALCSVEAVFNGVDIEVTVEFSAGGGTFEHDELTAESRAKTNQHPISSITGLQSALDGKANSAHVHTISDVTGLQSALDGKSNVGHGHSISDITGLTILDIPEFADTQITPLAVEATYTPTVWSYLVGLFTTVPKSVKEHIVKIWSRLQLLEDKYILKYVVPVNTNTIILNTDKNGNAFNFTKGESIKITIKIESFVGGVVDRVNLRINGIATAKYISVGSLLTFIVGTGSAYYGQYTTWTITVNDGEITGQASTSLKGANTTTWSANQVYDVKSIGLNISSITSLTFFSFSASNIIPAGTIIEITK